MSLHKRFYSRATFSFKGIGIWCVKYGKLGKFSDLKTYIHFTILFALLTHSLSVFLLASVTDAKTKVFYLE